MNGRPPRAEEAVVAGDRIGAGAGRVRNASGPGFVAFPGRSRKGLRPGGAGGRGGPRKGVPVAGA
ncbi:hypothetical protein ACF08W_14230 [Streptomyces sp. NPDC015144]|uniref:hypothetical protein n=1 Tax=Streptomyces sp. NPDC015144 TaxID=3364944 RepID=UPI0036FBA5A2